MKMFRIITSASATGIEYFPDDLPKFREGEHVRVIAGDFEGAEGTIVRIKKDRRLVVTITGVCAVATPHLPQEFLDCVAKVKRTYYTNSVTDGSVIDVLYDKFFAATGTELYGSVNDNEGTRWLYYKEVTGLSAPSNAASTGRIKYALNAKTSPQNCWTFSSYRSGSYYVWYRSTAGQLYSYNASFSSRAVPACVIG